MARMEDAMMVVMTAKQARGMEMRRANGRPSAYRETKRGIVMEERGSWSLNCGGEGRLENSKRTKSYSIYRVCTYSVPR